MRVHGRFTPVGAAIIAIEMGRSIVKQPGIQRTGAPPASSEACSLALRPSPPGSPDAPLDGRRAAQQEVFLREVDDALREDEMLGAFRRHGRLALMVVGIGLALFGAVLWWNHHQADLAGERGEKLTVALDDVAQGRAVPADKELQVLADSSGAGTKAAASMIRAGIALQQGRTADAVKLFSAIAADSSAPQPYRDLANIREVAANFDAMPPQQVVDRLKPLAMPGNPWFGSAGELVGMAYLKQNNTALAGPLFAAIARDKDTPDTLRNRVRQLAGLLGVDAIDDTAKAAGGAQP